MNTALRWGAVLALCLLAACGGGRSPYGGTSRPTGVKLGKPYTIDGQLYTPKYEPDYAEEGIASWYGPGFHGRMTASGERYNMHDLTAAHRTLPMPALLRVTALENGRSIIVRVNDRGPFKKGRLIDLSSGSAEALGMKPTGTTRVRIEYLPEATDKYLTDIGLARPDWMTKPTSPHAPEAQYAAIAAETGVGIHPAPGYAAPTPTPSAQAAVNPSMAGASPPPSTSPFSDTTPAIPPGPGQDSPFGRASAPIDTGSVPVPASPAPVAAAPASHGGGRYFVQTAAFGSEANARAHAARIAALGAVVTRPTSVNGHAFYRVMVGPFVGAPEAQQTLDRAKGMGFTDARILVQ